MSKKKIATLVTLTLIAMASLIGYQAYLMLRPNYTISYETTRILEPIGEDGRIDYLEAIRQTQNKGVTPENNAVVLLREAFGRAEIPDEHLENYFRELGMEVSPVDGDHISSIEDFAKTLPEAEQTSQDEIREQLEAAQSRPWAAEEFPIVAQWIQSADKPLEIAHRASLRPKYCPPLILPDGQLLSVLLPDSHMSRILGRILSARAMVRLGDKNTDAAREDSMTIHRIARLIGSAPWFVESMVGCSLELIATAVDLQISEHGNLTAEQARKFSAQLRALGPITDIASVLDRGERFSLLDFAGSLGRGDTGTDGVPSRSFTPGTLFNSNAGMAITNELFDEVVSAFRIPDRHERNAALSSVRSKLDRLSAESNQIGIGSIIGYGDSVSATISKRTALMLFPNVSSFGLAVDRCETRQRLVQMSLALSGWKAHHGDYPESLEQLKPDYIDAVPIDIFSGNSLLYRRNDDGFLLYSVGVNEVDDGGFEPKSGIIDGDIAVQAAGFEPMRHQEFSSHADKSGEEPIHAVE